MKAPRPAWWIYIAGLIPLVLIGNKMRSSLGDLPSFAMLIGYLLLLRLVAEIVERKLRD